MRRPHVRLQPLLPVDLEFERLKALADARYLVLVGEQDVARRDDGQVEGVGLHDQGAQQLADRPGRGEVLEADDCRAHGEPVIARPAPQRLKRVDELRTFHALDRTAGFFFAGARQGRSRALIARGRALAAHHQALAPLRVADRPT
jgi:hypothetical protein